MIRSLVFLTFAVNGHAVMVHEEPALPDGWEYSSLSYASIAFRLSLKQRNLDQLAATAKRVSDPSDSMYGQYLTRSEIEDMTVPPQSAVRAVVGWATSINGCAASVTREVVSVECSKESAEQLLSTVCRKVTNEGYKQAATRCADYVLPDSVHEVLQAMYGLHGLPLPPKPKRSKRVLDSPGGPADVTPEVIATTYKVSGVTASGSDKNRQAVAAFIGQTMSSEDLATFWAKYVPKAKAEQGKVYKFVGDPGEGAPGDESMLDIQYIMGVAPGILTEFWYYKPMDFCADLKNWTMSILAEDSPPLVHSVSYGWQGNMATLPGCLMANVNDVDVDFIKLAARGITIVFASGDAGGGYTPPQCGSSQEDPRTSSPPGSQKGKALHGTVAASYSTSAAAYCCGYASRVGHFHWTFIGKDPDTCGSQTVIKGVTLDGDSWKHNITSSQDECCSFAWNFQWKPNWSWNSDTKKCSVFWRVTGRHTDPNSVAGMGAFPGVGRCEVFSEVTGSEDNKLATSSGPATKPSYFEMYPSWPASSPWVTAVGATRFVDQKVGQPEMATDQFGSGGGFSDMFDAFDEQKASISKFFSMKTLTPPDGSYTKTGRGTPDVAGLGEGYQVIIDGQATSVGGTSASAPMFAGLVSLLNEARINKGMKPMGYLNPWIYKNAAAFTDVTRGDNFRGRDDDEPYGWNCTVGWDPVTGIGTPLFDKMLAAATATGSVIV